MAQIWGGGQSQEFNFGRVNYLLDNIYYGLEIPIRCPVGGIEQAVEHMSGV